MKYVGEKFFGMVVRAGSGQKFGEADRLSDYSVVSSSSLCSLLLSTNCA